jgi:hypothetical protein
MTALTDLPPTQRLQQVCRVIGIGYGITSTGPAPIVTAP